MIAEERQGTFDKIVVLHATVTEETTEILVLETTRHEEDTKTMMAAGKEEERKGDLEKNYPVTETPHPLHTDELSSTMVTMVCHTATEVMAPLTRMIERNLEA